VSRSKRDALHDSPAIDFNPSRWPLDRDDEDEVYFPFGHGSRKCPGLPFAQTEMVAVLPKIFKDYNVELVVSDETLAVCNGNVRMAWQRTRDDAIRRLKDDVETNLNI